MTSANCGSPNCMTAMGEGSGPVFDDLDRDKLMRELTGEPEDPRELEREGLDMRMWGPVACLQQTPPQNQTNEPEQEQGTRPQEWNR